MPETPPVPLNYADPLVTGRGGQRWFEAARWCAVVGWLTCAVAWALVLVVDTNTVLVTGPILLALGTATIVGGVRTRFRSAIVTGTGLCSLCAALFMLVHVFHWGPHEARGPFLAIGAVYIVLTALPTIFVIAARYERR